MNDQNNYVNTSSRMLSRREGPRVSIPGYTFDESVGMFYKITDENVDPTPDTDGLKCWVTDPESAVYVWQCEDNTFHSPNPPEGSVVIPKPTRQGINHEYNTF